MRFPLVAPIAFAAICSLVREGVADSDRAVPGHVRSQLDRRLHLVIAGGAGIDGFLGGSLRDMASTGPAWNVRVGISDPSNVRFELQYSGTSQPIDALDARLISHGLQALVRINVAPRSSFEPFFYAGGGWTRFHISGSTGFRAPDHVVEMPLGAGIARRFGKFVVDLRGGVSITSGADLVPVTMPDGSSNAEPLHRINVRTSVGFEL